MLGRTLVRALEPDHAVAAWTRSQGDLTVPGLALDLCRRAQPEVVIHCAAYTQVDRAESDPEAAYAGNVVATAEVAAAAHRVGARLLHFSTDYVFDGRGDRPYHEDDPTGPRTVYGRTKLGSEEAVRAHCPDHAIFRIAWLYGEGGPSFVHTVVKLARTRAGPLKMVHDQRGNPTSCDAVADVVKTWLKRPFVGTAHTTCQGEATWFEFAQRILQELGTDVELVPCATSEFPRPAPRPSNSRLDNRRLRVAGFEPMPLWDGALVDFLQRERPALIASVD